jgi:hypothetical protein
MSKKAATEIPLGAEVVAVDYRGVRVEGTVETRNWSFNKLINYVVREHSDGRSYDATPTHTIWVGHDQIWLA